MSERGLAVDPVGVVTGGDEELSGDVKADPLEGEQGWGERGDERVEVVVEFGDLDAEGLDPTGDGRQRPFRGGARVDESTWSWGPFRGR